MKCKSSFIHMGKGSITMLVLLLLACGCNKRPEGVLSDDEMTDLLADLIVADAYEQSGSAGNLPDSVRPRLADAILKQHNVDQATLDSTYAWYSRNLDEYYALYTKVDKNLSQRRRDAGGVMDANSLENDIWPLPRHILFTKLSRNDVLTFFIPGDMVQKGESLEWKMFLSKSADMKLTLGVDYEDGTSSMSNRFVRGERNPSVLLVCDTGRRVRRIYGSIALERKEMPLWTDSITLSKNPFDSLVYMNFRGQRFLYGPRKKAPELLKIDSIANSRPEPVFKTEEEMTASKKTLSSDGYPIGGNTPAPMNRIKK